MLSMRNLGVDLASAWRGVRGGRLSSVAAVLALGLGIGAGITASAVAYAGLLRPIPLPDAARLVMLRKVFGPTGNASGVKLNEFDEWRRQVSSTLDLAAYAPERTTLRDAAGAREVNAGYVLGPFFDMLGARAFAGRLPTDRSDAAVVSQRLATQLAATAGEALGRRFAVGGRSFEVVGVLPFSFAVFDDRDLWLPAQSVAALNLVGQGDARNYRLIARLQPGRSFDDARAEATRAALATLPQAQRASYRLEMQPLRESLVGAARPVILTFLTASLLVLLVACANVAMLVVTRAVTRTREFAVRIALGASRGRLFRVLALETTILAVAGAAIGWWIASVAAALLERQTGLDIPRLATFTTSTPITAGAGMAVLFVVAACGAAPMLAIGHSTLATSLRVMASTGAPATRRLRDGLVITELAVAVVLLTGAGLLGRTVWALSHTDLGVNAPEHVLAVTVPIGESAETDRAARVAIVGAMLQEVRRLPGVTAAGVSGNLPPDAPGINFTIRYTTTDGNTDSTRAFDLVPTSDGALEALGARLVAGRHFTEADALSSQAVAVMSESALRHLGREAAGAIDRDLPMTLPSASGVRVKPRVIGVIRDIRYAGLDTSAHGGIYVPWRQLPVGRAHLIVRTMGDPSTLAVDVMRIVSRADPSLPPGEARTLAAQVDRALLPRTTRFGLISVFAAAAILLAFVGLSGALLRSVAERRRELAIRAAVGATPTVLLQSVLRHGLGLVAAGILLGLAASVAFGRAMASLVFGVKPIDPATGAAATLAVLVIALGVCYLPARRAAAADPVELLRSE